MSSIPKAIVERDKAGVEKLTYYGVLVTQLEHDELLAALNVSEQKARSHFQAFVDAGEFRRAVRPLDFGSVRK